MASLAERIGCPSLHRSVTFRGAGSSKPPYSGPAGLSSISFYAMKRMPANPFDIVPSHFDGCAAGPAHRYVDPKPGAPAEYRGEFGVINSRVPGIVPVRYPATDGRMMNRVVDRAQLASSRRRSFLRRSDLLTGYNASPNPDENIYPSCGAIVSGNSAI